MSAVQDKPLAKSYSRARKARDARFDGVFFTAVKSTGIYCRPICPANPPLEKNVEYYSSAISAAQAGFRPCLRCRPDSAPQSSAWLGSETSFQRALGLIQAGALQEQSVDDLALRLGISARYLRELFQANLGTSPKQYAIYQQCLFAKQLLHNSDLAMQDVAYAAGFNSVRRFNEAIKDLLKLTPSDIRARRTPKEKGLVLKLNYRPPFAWNSLFEFLKRRVIESLEWISESTGRQSYSRTIEYRTTRGYFTAEHLAQSNQIALSLHLNEYQYLSAIVQKIRLLFDLDAPIYEIDKHLISCVGGSIEYQEGLRIPGIWGAFEAGVRAILGQQVSVAAANTLVTTMLENLGDEVEFKSGMQRRYFPRPQDVVDDPLDFFRMPQSRKDTIRRLAYHFIEHPYPEQINDWLEIKGIGPWTVNYVKLRASKDPDIWLAGDAGIKNAIKAVGREPDLEQTQPWRSYLTFQMWNQL